MSVGLNDLMAVDHLLDLFAHRFSCFSFISFCFSYSYMSRPSWPTLWSTFGRTKK